MRLLLDPNHSFGSARQAKSKTLVIQDLQILIEEAVQIVLFVKVYSTVRVVLLLELDSTVSRSG